MRVSNDHSPYLHTNYGFVNSQINGPSQQSALKIFGYGSERSVNKVAYPQGGSGLSGLSNYINTELLLNLAFQVLNSTGERDGFLGWIQRNSGTINTVVQAADFARQVVPLATSGEALTGEAIAGALSGGGVATEGLGSGPSSSMGTYLSYAQQAYGAYQILSSDASDEAKAQALAKQAGLFVADMYTFGLASTAYGFLSRSETFREFEAKMSKYSPVMEGAASIGSIWGGDGDAEDYLNLATGGMTSVMGNIFGFDLGHKSTKEYQAERAAGAYEAAATDADREYISRMYEAKLEAPDDNIIRDPNNPYFGKEWKWHEQKPLLGPQDVWGFMGFQEAFPDFISGYTEEQRTMIAQAALDEDLLVSDKGNVIFSNSHRTPEGLTHLERIQQIAQEIRAGIYVPSSKIG